MDNTWRFIKYFFPGIFLLIVVSIGGCRAAQDTVCLRGHCFSVELADTPESRERGLQERDVLEENAGMLFIFPQSREQVFWMKDTMIPLDMIWLDFSQRVVYVEHDVPPCESDPCPTYSSQKKALYVLEINAGESAKIGIEEGDRAEFHLLSR